MKESYSACDVTTKPSVPHCNTLLPPSQIPFTPSFEDLASIASGVSSPLLHDSSGSNESLEEDAISVKSHDAKSRSSLKNPSPVLWKRRNVGVQEKRDRFQSMRHSNSDVLALTHLKEKEEEQERKRDPMSSEESNSLAQKRKILLRIHEATESDPTFSSHITCVPPTTEEEKVPSGTLSSLEHHLECDRRSVRPRHIYKATGMYGFMQCVVCHVMWCVWSYDAVCVVM